MVLVQLLLPICGNDGEKFELEYFDSVRNTLIVKFGGVTVFTNSVAEGTWDSGGSWVNDKLVMFEVVVREVDHRWWHSFISELKITFHQQEIHCRANPITLVGQ